MTTALRKMRWFDVAPAAVIERELFGDEAWTDAMLWSELAERETRHYLAADDAEGLVGYAGLCAYDADEAYVQTIAVAGRGQRHGIGTRLLLALLDEAARRNSRRVDLEVRADNDVAQRLYAKHGFREIGVRRNYYQPSGTDAVVMRCEVGR
ncbi:MAG TPA: ribosomal protein S18-alanine N-acetyltransferase [Mycobacteriales bacterium]|nr:ribosomal protein S18-alanine N-acetyltransferase [Mycobacteriales bacterium]